MEFILYIMNYKHGDDVNYEVTLSCLFYTVTVYSKKMFIKMKTIFCDSVHQRTRKVFLSSSVCNLFQFGERQNWSKTAEKVQYSHRT